MLYLGSRSITGAPAGHTGHFSPCQDSISFTSFSDQDIDLACPDASRRVPRGCQGPVVTSPVLTSHTGNLSIEAEGPNEAEIC
jgi:hypothetical protein